MSVRSAGLAARRIFTVSGPTEGIILRMFCVRCVWDRGVDAIEEEFAVVAGYADVDKGRSGDFGDPPGEEFPNEVREDTAGRFVGLFRVSAAEYFALGAPELRRVGAGFLLGVEGGPPRIFHGSAVPCTGIVQVGRDAVIRVDVAPGAEGIADVALAIDLEVVGSTRSMMF